MPFHRRAVGSGLLEAPRATARQGEDEDEGRPELCSLCSARTRRGNRKPFSEGAVRSAAGGACACGDARHPHITVPVRRATSCIEYDYASRPVCPPARRPKAKAAKAERPSTTLLLASLSLPPSPSISLLLVWASLGSGSDAPVSRWRPAHSHIQLTLRAGPGPGRGRAGAGPVCSPGRGQDGDGDGAATLGRHTPTGGGAGLFPRSRSPALSAVDAATEMADRSARAAAPALDAETMAPNVVSAGILAAECDCGQVHDADHVHEHALVGGGGVAGAPRWQGLPWGYPKARDKGVMATVDDWLADRRRLDGAEGLWRVEDNLYDLTPFLDRHPGGREWLQLTRGTDITEVFFAHHVAETAEALLPKFLARPATAPRNSPFTFHRDGFYMQLRERVRKVLDDTPKPVLEAAKQRSKTIVDVLAASALLTCALAGYFRSFFVLGTVAGILVSVTASAAHNFFHQKHNWRRFYFELSFMSSREWMVSHALSHHIFPNTLQDLEVTFFEPFVSFLPYPSKHLVVRYLSWGYSVVMYAVLGHGQFGKRLLNLRLEPTDAVALAVPASVLLAGTPLLDAWLLWSWVLVVSSFYFGYQGLSAGHHHPDNYHEGDALGADHDFGLMQLAATSTCTGLRGRTWLLLTLTHFGDHRLHHMFPALDHAVLPLLEPALDEHLAQYRLPNVTITSWEALRGKYLQMARNRPNPRPAS